MAGQRRALCVGINDYPYDGSDLNGCVNDARGWADVLKTRFQFTEVKLLLDQDATKARVLEGLKDLLAGASAGDELVFTSSSHGSYVADTDGDEERYDEIVCPYDIADNHILDDELRNLFSNVAQGVNVSVVLDNCFSGTATRAAVSEILPGMRTPDDRRVRFLSPALRGGKVLENPWRARPNSEVKHPESKMREILLTGCTDREYSYDARIDGKYHGAMSYYALQAIAEADGHLTFQQLHDRIVNLIVDYPQSPQLEGSRASKKRPIFGGVGAPAARVAGRTT
jgi:metacaspase-1